MVTRARSSDGAGRVASKATLRSPPAAGRRSGPRAGPAGSSASRSGRGHVASPHPAWSTAHIRPSPASRSASTTLIDTSDGRRRGRTTSSDRGTRSIGDRSGRRRRTPSSSVQAVARQAASARTSSSAAVAAPPTVARAVPRCRDDLVVAGRVDGCRRSPSHRRRCTRPATIRHREPAPPRPHPSCDARDRRIGSRERRATDGAISVRLGLDCLRAPLRRRRAPVAQEMTAMTTIPGPHGPARAAGRETADRRHRSTRSSRSPTSYGRTFAVHLGPTDDRHRRRPRAREGRAHRAAGAVPVGAGVQAAARRVRRPDVDARQRRRRPRPSTFARAAGVRTPQAPGVARADHRRARPHDRRLPGRRAVRPRATHPGHGPPDRRPRALRRRARCRRRRHRRPARACERVHQPTDAPAVPPPLPVGCPRARPGVTARVRRAARRGDRPPARPRDRATNGPTSSTRCSRPTDSPSRSSRTRSSRSSAPVSTPPPPPRAGSCMRAGARRRRVGPPARPRPTPPRPTTPGRGPRPSCTSRCASIRPGPYSPRLVAESFDLGPYRVKQRSLIAWSPLLTGRDPASWPDPMRFDPARHLDHDEPEYAWVPFGAGSRSCLGFGLARTNLTLLASRLAQRVDLVPGGPRSPRRSG